MPGLLQAAIFRSIFEPCYRFFAVHHHTRQRHIKKTASLNRPPNNHFFTNN